jgi:hypothetical protein
LTKNPENLTLASDSRALQHSPSNPLKQPQTPTPQKKEGECTPTHPSHEITDGIMDSSPSAVFDQARNRMHAQNGLLHWLLIE